MKNSILDIPCAPAVSRGDEFVDLSRGARRFGLPVETLFLEGSVLNDYAELDPALGYNVAGTILSVLHNQVRQIGGLDEFVTVCLVRREDARAVELELALKHRKRFGRGCIMLRKSAERPTESLQN